MNQMCRYFTVLLLVTNIVTADARPADDDPAGDSGEARNVGPRVGNDCEQLSVTSGSGMLQSSGYDGDGYESNQVDCWTLQLGPTDRLTLMFSSFEVEAHDLCKWDSLTVYLGSQTVEKLCGYNTPDDVMVTSPGEVIIQFLSDGYVNKQGFSMSYIIDLKCDVITGDGEIETSHPYDNSDTLCWILNAPSGSVTLTFSEFELEDESDCDYDVVRVYDGSEVTSNNLIDQYCGEDIPPPITSTGSSLLVIFISDPIVQRNGFVAEVRSEMTLEVTSIAPPIVNDNDCLIIRTPQVIGTPRPYDRMEELCWILVAAPGEEVTLNFEEFDVEDETDCAYDSVKIYTGVTNNRENRIATLCGDEVTGDMTYTSQSLYMEFESDEYVQRDGFVAAVTFTGSTAQEVTIPETTTTQATTAQTTGATLPEEKDCTYLSVFGNFSSPGYDGQSNYEHNLNLCWIITAEPGETVYLKFLDVNLERFCYYDYLVIYDGEEETDSNFNNRLCGVDTPFEPYTSTGRRMLIRMITDDKFAHHGFNAWYASHGNSNNVPCGEPSIEPRDPGQFVVNGREAIPHSWPWMTYIRANGGGYCGGSIVSKNYVITAAHCLFLQYNVTKEDFTVTVGKHHLRDNEIGQQVFGVSQVAYHPDYVIGRYIYDIALLRLNESIIFHDNVSPVCIPNPEQEVEGLVAATGWGSTQDTGGDRKKLQEVYVPLIPNEVCSQRDWYGSSVKDHMVCAGYEQGMKDTCQGDSGGPLVQKRNGVYSLYGITSWGRGCAEPKHPGVYTSTRFFADWIAEYSYGEVIPLDVMT